MKKIEYTIFKKNKLLFAILWIIIYVISLSVADNISDLLGVRKSVTAVISAILTTILITWIKKNHLFREYGLCRSTIPLRRLLYYIPLVIIASINLWFGVALNFSPIETFFYIISMLFVGFLEELIFRGLLFKAMLKDGTKSASLISSVTFGLGHIINLINGSGMPLFSNLLQVTYAIAIGFLFTILFYKTKTLWPCIITHSIVNSLSIFTNQSAITPAREILTALALIVIPLLYAAYIIKVQESFSVQS